MPPSSPRCRCARASASRATTCGSSARAPAKFTPRATRMCWGGLPSEMWQGTPCCPGATSVLSSDELPRRKIVFLSGTRADFGKLKSLIRTLLHDPPRFEVHIFATGMHMDPKYGFTVLEFEKCNFPNVYRYINSNAGGTMDQALGTTIQGFGQYVRLIQPDLIVVHGDRCEALAGAIVGSLNNILVAHIEGGELSGTVDGLIRHSVSKMSHLHFVSNAEARRRLVQLGEDPDTVFVIGSPDVDVMTSPDLPSLEDVKRHYEIAFSNYGILAFHPVTTSLSS